LRSKDREIALHRSEIRALTVSSVAAFVLPRLDATSREAMFHPLEPKYVASRHP
jgi:hypothetical protein